MYKRKLVVTEIIKLGILIVIEIVFLTLSHQWLYFRIYNSSKIINSIKKKYFTCVFFVRHSLSFTSQRCWNIFLNFKNSISRIILWSSKLYLLYKFIKVLSNLWHFFSCCVRVLQILLSLKSQTHANQTK